MTIRTGVRALALSTFVAPLAFAGCGSSGAPNATPDLGVETVVAAKADIEALPYRVKINAAPKDRDALVVHVHDKSGGRFRYIIWVIGGGDENLGVHGLHWREMDIVALTHRYSVAWAEPASGETQTQREERRKIAGAYEDALCEQAIGEACGI